MLIKIQLFLFVKFFNGYKYNFSNIVLLSNWFNWIFYDAFEFFKRDIILNELIESEYDSTSFLIKLLIFLDQNIENNTNLKILIPFLVQKLMSNFGCNKLNCAFIYRLYQNKIIPINKIIDEIIKSITLNEYKTKKDEGKKKSNNIFTSRSEETISENRMFYYDYMIKYDNTFNIENINNMIVWFFPELIRCKACSLDNILNKLDDPNKNFLKLYFPNGKEKFMLMRDNGEPDDELTRVIRNDDVERLSTIISHKKD